ncbi:MAG TPA: dihydrolipoyl dehydrogenase [Deltaproteobacteria bacterium]|nr:MAG: dihydrolipoyl dehydrogenase [Deltaproteobacteria bacterium GWA2_55_82]OGQ64020.1 MAG: dihydrolipoyl dehydrogenase [Deltaproteobacteria bacterium RIFCSPLOWO2_02_FULL_55_12]OIJ75038.1 MAG: dihydrolipoyl dehydrogenase [Deltaproteobacteria bacterium GWC2_55_46]HBG47313.1 dihydrolipoyl dehydrogenase [Deltaproteobacteria bacterium]HCY10079.1 dihydrolipoyl dehydrogenase [Deltaproteobacteria bacterium]
MKEFDCVVIGAGPGGYVAAIRAAQLGARTAIIERNKIGGTCLNRGCIPTKALYYSARTIESAKRASEFGVNVGEVSFDLARAVERKDGIVKKLVGGIEQLLKGNKVEVIKGDGFLESAVKVRVSNGEDAETVAAKSIIIATGSEPAMIPAFNIDGVHVLTSTEMLDLKKVPESLLIIGGGVMGCEFATLFSSFGSRVMIVELLPSILSTEDKMVGRVIVKKFKETGVSVLTEVQVESVVPENGHVKTTLKDGREFITEKVLVSIGRSFNSAGIGLDAAGVKVEKGRVAVDERMETNVKGVFAIGDVTGKMLLAHVASSQGIVAANNALGKNARMDYSVIPAGIFTDPEIASVGLREKEAEEKGIPVSIGRFPYAASGKALGMGETEGFVQMLADPGTDKVLGCSIVGAHATDLIGEVAVAMKAGVTVKELTETVHAHPTLPEMVMEAAEDVHGMAIHKIGRKR